MLTFEIEGLPELARHLDEVANAVVNPIVADALAKGGEVIRGQAVRNVHRLTGALADDLVIVTRIRSDGSERYVLIGPAWNPENFRRSVQRRGKYAQEAPSPDQTTNPGLYGMFLETGHRGPGEGLAHDLDYKRAAYAARKAHQKINTSEFGTLSTPPYPWLGPAFDSTKDEALQVVADSIREGLESLHIA